MKIRKFIAPTVRQALQDIRNELGDEAVILSNRNVNDGEVEIIALSNETMEQLTDSVTAGFSNRGLPERGLLDRGLPGRELPKREAKDKPAFPAEAETKKYAPEHDSILAEIKSMQSMLQQQFSTLSWNGMQRDPQRANLLCKMLNSGFSAPLIRQLLGKIPAGHADGESWIKQVLKHNLKAADEENGIVAKGGVYALIGPTGVGKTTTAAKLAARAVVRYGANKVALLTTDSYRIGAYEQLKIYGKILGVAVHAVKDTADLRLTLSALKHKHLVLVDTVGMGQRDERVGDQNEMFDAVGVDRLLLLNATCAAGTLEDMVSMYYSQSVIGCVVTKLDEAVNLGAVLDVVIRHRLVLHYMANGQGVPEDLHPVDLDYLLHRTFEPVEEKNLQTLNEMEFPVFMAGTSNESISYAA